MHGRLVTLVAAMLATSVSAASTDDDWTSKSVPIAVFGQFPQLQSPQVSPSGKLIATKIRIANGQALAIVSIGGKDKPEVIARDGAESVDKEGDREIASWRWLDDDRLLVTLWYRDNYAGQWFDLQRFAVYNRTTRKAVPLAWTGSFASMNLLWTTPRSAPHAHVLLQRMTMANGTENMNLPEVVDVDVDSGATSLVQGSNPVVHDWTADSDGVVRIGTSYDSDSGKVRLLYRNDASEGFHTIVHEKSSMYDTIAAPSLLLHGGRAYAISRKDGYRALYDYDLKTMTIGKKVYGKDGYDIDGTLVNPARDRIDGVTVTDDRTRTVWFDPRMKQIQSLLDAKYGTGNAFIVSTDDAHEKIVFRAARPGQAPGFYLFDTVTGGIGLIGWHNETLKDAMLNPVSSVRYPTSDGKQVEAVLTMPRHRSGQRNLPLVVLPHGGPWARDDADWDSYQWAQAIAELGYVVIQPNYRGSSGYGREWEKAGEGNWGHRMSDDLNDAIPWLAAQGMIDAKRVCIFGWSYGGYAAARAAQRDGATYRCAIAGAAPVDMPAMVAYDRNYLGRYAAKQALGSASTDLRDISPALHADQVSIPLLIIHGAKDQRVPVAQARGFVDRLKKAGKVPGRDFTYLEQPQNTHNLLRESDRVQMLEAVRDFLAKYDPA